MAGDLMPLSPGQDGLSGEEISHKLRELLIRHSNGRSSSVDVDEANQISGSLLYTLDAGIRAGAEPGSSVEVLYQRGQQRIQTALRKIEALWHNATASQIPFGTTAYFACVNEAIPVFLRDYDAEFAAQVTMPLCDDFDYPLAVDDDVPLTGALYVERYLRCICLENFLLSRFPLDSIRVLLLRCNTRNGSHYKHLLLNLCALVLDHALLCALAGEQPTRLVLPYEQVLVQTTQLRMLSPEALEAELLRGAEAVAEAIGPLDNGSRDYCVRYARTALPAFAAALKGNDLAPLILWDEENPATPALVMKQGPRLTDRQLADLTQAIMDCDDLEKKFAMVRSSTSSMEDFLDLMKASCLFGDEYAGLFASMDDLELMVLGKTVFGDTAHTLRPDSEWEQALLESVQSRRGSR